MTASINGQVLVSSGTTLCGAIRHTRHGIRIEILRIENREREIAIPFWRQLLALQRGLAKNIEQSIKSA